MINSGDMSKGRVSFPHVDTASESSEALLGHHYSMEIPAWEYKHQHGSTRARRKKILFAQLRRPSPPTVALLCYSLAGLSSRRLEHGHTQTRVSATARQTKHRSAHKLHHLAGLETPKCRCRRCQKCGVFAGQADVQRYSLRMGLPDASASACPCAGRQKSCQLYNSIAWQLESLVVFAIGALVISTATQHASCKISCAKNLSPFCLAVKVIEYHPPRLLIVHTSQGSTTTSPSSFSFSVFPPPTQEQLEHAS